MEALKPRPEACLCVDSVKKRSGEGLEVARMELEEREKVREELHGVQLWLEAADVLLNEMEQGRSTEELQVRRSSTGSSHFLFDVSVEITFTAFGSQSGIGVSDCSRETLGT